LDEGKVVLLGDTRTAATRPSFMPLTFPEASLFGIKAHLESRRDVIERFIKAFHKGYTDIVKGGDVNAIADLVRANRDTFKSVSIEDVRSQIQACLGYVAPNEGLIPESGWAQAQSIFHDGGLTFVDPADPTYSYANVVDMSYYNAATGK